MKVPKRIQPLVDDGIIDEVMSRLMSGKEADVFIVRCGTEMRCAKVYKEAMKRSFKKAAEYTEGRKVRSGRRARSIWLKADAMNGGTAPSPKYREEPSIPSQGWNKNCSKQCGQLGLQ